MFPSAGGVESNGKSNRCKMTTCDRMYYNVRRLSNNQIFNQKNGQPKSKIGQLIKVMKLPDRLDASVSEIKVYSELFYWV